MGSSPPEAIVVGAGHNGLACAAYLARAGLSVQVVEAGESVGGACVTEELWPGFRLSTAAYALSLLAPSVVTELGLRLDVRAKDPEAFLPLEDGGGVTLWRDPARKREEIARISRADARAYERFFGLFEEAARCLRPLLMYPATRRQARRAFRKSEVEGLFAKTVDGSIAALCEEHFESDVIQGAMASQGIIGSAAGPRTPGTAYVYLHHAFGLAAGEPGAWGFVRGGMGAVTAALRDAVAAAGGEIKTGAEVISLVYDGGARRATGVALADGTEIRARTICLSVDPARVVKLAGADNLPAEFVEDVGVLPLEGTVVKVNCALGGLPRFAGIGREGVVGPEHLGTITIAPSIGYLEDSCRSAASGEVGEMFCEAWIQTASEPELAPAGKHTLSVFAQYAPYRLAKGTWEERREEVGDRVIATLERYMPGLSSLIEHRLVLGPPDLEQRFRLTGGNIFHGELLPDWLFDRRPAASWHRYRAPIPGLYMCGAGTHGGGGVSGIPGRNAARAVLHDLAAAGGRSRFGVPVVG